MDLALSPPPLRRLPPGAWTVLAWCAGLVYSCIVSVRLPGEADFLPRTGLDLTAGHWGLLAASAALTPAGGVLLHRRPLPALALLLTGAAAMAMALNSTEITFPQFLAAETALVQIAAIWPRRTSLAAAAMTLGTPVCYAVARLLLGFPIGTSTLLVVALTAVIAWLVGHSLRQSREHARTLRAQAITAERLRIARELHDMVAHSMGIIAIQAGAASMVIDTQPARAREALKAIDNAGRQTLAGLRRMLVTLRQAEPAPAVAGPVAGLADLERLVATTATAGVHVEVRWRGRRDPLPPEIDLSAFRIVQEAVTNVVRHAGTPRCRVSIDRREEELSIEVVDSGRGGPAGTGYGIVGMRERVELLHGHFTAGPRPEGGFRVAARLPLPRQAR